MNEESSWTVYRTRFVVRARQLTKPLMFTDVLGREHSGQPGDYLVESSQGFLRITPRELFEDIYVPLDSVPPEVSAELASSAARPVRSLVEDRSPRHGSPDARVLAWSNSERPALRPAVRLVARSS